MLTPNRDNDDEFPKIDLSLGQALFNPNIPDKASKLFDPSVLKNPAGNSATSTFDNIQVGDIYSTYMAGGFSTYQPGVDGPLVGVRQFNPLSVFASYTYRISLYMLTPEAYNIFIESGRKTLNLNSIGAGELGEGVFLVAQSGGINNTAENRAPSFNYNYYIDDLKIKSVCANLGTKDTTAGTYDLSFSIYEPYSFSFLSDLKRAADYISRLSNTNIQQLQNPLRQLYVLGISFVGYDDQGNVVDGKDIANGFNGVYGDNLNINDRYLDLEIYDFKFKVDGKPVRYDIKAKARPAIAFTSKRGRTTKETSVAGVTLNDALQGPKGLFTQLNKQNFEFKDSGQVTEVTQYEVKYVGPGATALANAKLVTEAQINKYNFNTLVSRARQTAESTDATGIAAEPDPTTRTFSFTQNTSIIQAIEDMIKGSEYMTAALKVIQENTIQTNPLLKSIREIPTQTKKSISWYSVSSQLKNPRYDQKTKDWAYDITYVIETYNTPVVTSPFVRPDTKWYGHHKSYQYWYTGKNTEVLSYEFNADLAYFVNLSAPVPLTENKTEISKTASENISPVSPGRRAPGSNTNTLGAGLQAQNHFLTTLFNPNYVKVKVLINGDPDFINTGGSIPTNELYNKFYETDNFTINPNGGQVFFEIVFFEGQDYDDNQGTLQINESILFFNSEVARKYTKGVSHMLYDIESTFSKGKFTQQLTGTITPFGLTDEAAEDPTSREVTQDTGSSDGGQESTSVGFMKDKLFTETDTNDFGLDVPQTLSQYRNEDQLPTGAFGNIGIQPVIQNQREDDFPVSLSRPRNFGSPFGP